MQKVVVITGASSGIGLATAEYLRDQGYIVYSFSRSAPKLDGIQHVACDVSDRFIIHQAFATVFEREGRIDAVVNNAGMGISGSMEYQSLPDIHRITSINLLGVINCCAEAIPYLRESRGRIINIGSLAGEFAIPFQTMYTTTKAGVQAFSMALLNELRPLGVRVTCILPGDIRTSFTANRVKTDIPNDPVYGDRVRNSVARMEHDESHGMPPVSIARAIHRVLTRRNPPHLMTVGFKYKCLRLLKRFVSTKMLNRILYNMYSK